MDKISKGQRKMEDPVGGLLPAGKGHSLERNKTLVAALSGGGVMLSLLGSAGSLSEHRN